MPSPSPPRARGARRRRPKASKSPRAPRRALASESRAASALAGLTAEAQRACRRLPLLAPHAEALDGLAAWLDARHGALGEAAGQKVGQLVAHAGQLRAFLAAYPAARAASVPAHEIATVRTLVLLVRAALHAARACEQSGVAMWRRALRAYASKEALAEERDDVVRRPVDLLKLAAMWLALHRARGLLRMAHGRLDELRGKARSRFVGLAANVNQETLQLCHKKGRYSTTVVNIATSADVRETLVALRRVERSLELLMAGLGMPEPTWEAVLGATARPADDAAGVGMTDIDLSLHDVAHTLDQFWFELQHHAAIEAGSAAKASRGGSDAASDAALAAAAAAAAGDEASLSAATSTVTTSASGAAAANGDDQHEASLIESLTSLPDAGRAAPPPGRAAVLLNVFLFPPPRLRGAGGAGGARDAHDHKDSDTEEQEDALDFKHDDEAGGEDGDDGSLFGRGGHDRRRRRRRGSSHSRGSDGHGGGGGGGGGDSDDDDNSEDDDEVLARDHAYFASLHHPLWEHQLRESRREDKRRERRAAEASGAPPRSALVQSRSDPPPPPPAKGGFFSSLLRRGRRHSGSVRQDKRAQKKKKKKTVAFHSWNGTDNRGDADDDRLSAFDDDERGRELSRRMRHEALLRGVQHAARRAGAGTLQLVTPRYSADDGDALVLGLKCTAAGAPRVLRRFRRRLAVLAAAHLAHSGVEAAFKVQTFHHTLDIGLTEDGLPPPPPGGGRSLFLFRDFFRADARTLAALIDSVGRWLDETVPRGSVPRRRRNALLDASVDAVSELWERDGAATGAAPRVAVFRVCVALMDAFSTLFVDPMLQADYLPYSLVERPLAAGWPRDDLAEAAPAEAGASASASAVSAAAAAARPLKAASGSPPVVEAGETGLHPLRVRKADAFAAAGTSYAAGPVETLAQGAIFLRYDDAGAGDPVLEAVEAENGAPAPDGSHAGSAGGSLRRRRAPKPPVPVFVRVRASGPSRDDPELVWTELVPDPLAARVDDDFALPEDGAGRRGGMGGLAAPPSPVQSLRRVRRAYGEREAAGSDGAGLSSSSTTGAGSGTGRSGSMRLADAMWLYRGTRGAAFQLHARRYPGHPVPAHLCLSVVSRGATLDLQAADNDARERWLTAVAVVVTQLQTQQRIGESTADTYDREEAEAVAMASLGASSPTSRSSASSSSPAPSPAGGGSGGGGGRPAGGAGGAQVAPPLSPSSSSSSSSSSASSASSSASARAARAERSRRSQEGLRHILFLKQGGVLVKHGRKGRPHAKHVHAQHGRLVWATPEHHELARRRPARYVDLMLVTGVVPGKTTEVFARRWGAQVPPELCFSVIVHPDAGLSLPASNSSHSSLQSTEGTRRERDLPSRAGTKRTVDLQCSSEHARDEWVRAIRWLSRNTQKRRKIVRTFGGSAGGGLHSSSSLGSLNSLSAVDMAADQAADERAAADAERRREAQVKAQERATAAAAAAATAAAASEKAGGARPVLLRPSSGRSSARKLAPQPATIEEDPEREEIEAEEEEPYLPVLPSVRAASGALDDDDDDDDDYDDDDRAAGDDDDNSASASGGDVVVVDEAEEDDDDEDDDDDDDDDDFDVDDEYEAGLFPTGETPGGEPNSDPAEGDGGEEEPPAAGAAEADEKEAEDGTAPPPPLPPPPMWSTFGPAGSSPELRPSAAHAAKAAPASPARPTSRLSRRTRPSRATSVGSGHLAWLSGNSSASPARVRPDAAVARPPPGPSSRRSGTKKSPARTVPRSAAPAGGRAARASSPPKRTKSPGSVSSTSSRRTPRGGKKKKAAKASKKAAPKASGRPPKKAPVTPRGRRADASGTSRRRSSSVFRQKNESQIDLAETRFRGSFDLDGSPPPPLPPPVLERDEAGPDADDDFDYGDEAWEKGAGDGFALPGPASAARDDDGDDDGGGYDDDDSAAYGPGGLEDGPAFLAAVTELRRKLESAELRQSWYKLAAELNALEDLLADRNLAAIDGWWTELESLQRALGVLLQDRRPAIVQEACHVLMTLAEQLGSHPEFEPALRYFLRVLLKRLSSKRPQISTMVDACVRAVLSRSFEWAFRTLPLLSKVAQRETHAQVRQRSLEYLEQVLDEVPDERVDDEIAEYEARLATTLRNAMADPDKRVRGAARRLFLQFANLFPGHAHKLFQMFDERSQDLVARLVEKALTAPIGDGSDHVTPY